MPHLTVEYSGNLGLLEPKKLLHTLNQVMIQTGEFIATDIKSRAVRQDDFLVGLETSGHAYIHVKVALLSGRSAETKADIASQLLSALQQVVQAIPAMTLQLCVEVLEIDRSSYAKAVIQQ